MDSLDRRRAAAVVSALIISIALIPVALPPPIEIPILAITFSYLPGALLASRIVPGWSRAGRFLASLVLSPFLTGAVAALLIGIGLGVPSAARCVGVLIVAAALASAIGRSEISRSEQRRASEGSEGERIAWLAAGAWTLLIGALLLGNRNLIPRSDGWFHASVALAVLRGGVPPEDPFFAGLRLRDFWGPHAWAAMWPALHSTVSVWVPFVVMNLAGAFGAILGIALLARRIGANRRGVWGAILVAVLGAPPFAWVWIAGRAVTGRIPGFAGIERLVSHGLVPTLEAMSRGLLHISMVFFGGKFLVLTSFALGFAAFAAFLIAFIDLIENPASVRRALALGLFTSAALLIHAVIGLTAIALAAGWWGWGALRAVFFRDGRARGALLPVILAIAGGALILAPYVATILGGGQRIAFGIIRPGIVTWIYGGALVIPAAMIWMIRERRRNRPALEMLGLTSILTIPGIVLVLTGNNQSKYLNLLFYMAAAPAGIAWATLLARLRGVGRWGLIAILAAATLPTFSVSIWAYSRDPGEFEYATGGESSPIEREAFAWARANTPESAIFVEESESRDAAVLAGRSVLWGSDGWARKWGFPEEALRLRKETSVALSGGESLAPDLSAFAIALRRDLIVVARRRDADSTSSSWNAIPRAGPAYRALYSNPEIVLYRWEGKR
jgi:hypothetical protein